MDKGEKTITRVYVRTIPFEVRREKIFPKERQEEIENCTNEKVKKHKYYVWKLLEDAIQDTFGVGLEEVNIRKEGMRWVCDRYYFSLSHSSKCVAVGVSTCPIGVDIQCVKDVRDISSRILCDGENGDDLISIFSKKEAVFKSLGKDVFSPSLIDTRYNDVTSERLNIMGEEYVLSVACKLREFKQINMFEC